MEQQVSRREFIQWTGVGTAALATAGLGWEHLEALHASDGEEAAETGAEAVKLVPTVCLQCDGGCALLVKTINGRAIKVDGNPLSPLNGGKTCPKGQAALQMLYDPDRVKGPLERIGKRGSGEWRDITWEAALAQVERQLTDLRVSGHPERLLFLQGRSRGQMETIIDRFCRSFGTPNNITPGTISSDGFLVGQHLMQGVRTPLAYDWERCNYLLCFGAGFIESWRPTLRLVQAFSHLRTGRPGQRAKIVQVEPRYSMTASRADEWVPIRPGLDGALALGLAHVIVRERLYDADSVTKNTLGFEDWADEQGRAHRGFKSYLLEEYTTEKVSELTGIREEVIERLGREFATHRPAVAVGARGCSMHTNGVYTAMAIHALNALVGSIDAPGGAMVQQLPPLSPLPEVVLDPVARRGLHRPSITTTESGNCLLAEHVHQNVPEALRSGQPYPAEAAFLYYTNPLFSSLNVSAWHQSLGKVPFIVSFSPFLDDTSLHADLILPDHTFLERWQDDICRPGLGYPLWSLRQPVVKPIHNTYDTGDVLLELARRLGGGVAASLPWHSLKDVVRARAHGVYQSRRGSFVAETFEEWWQTFTERGVWADPDYAPGSPLNPQSQIRDPHSEGGTPSGRFEFFSQRLHHLMEHRAIEVARQTGLSTEEALDQLLRKAQVQARGDKVYLPHYEPPRYVGLEQAYPLHFVTYKLMTHAEGRGANTPLLQEMLGLQTHSQWDSWVEINPETARRHGIGDRDWVVVESPVGEIRTRARILAGAHPEVISMPFEHGHRAYGRWAVNRGVNPNWILGDERDHLAGLGAPFATRVKIYRSA